MVFGFDQINKKEFSMAAFFGEEPVMRITTLASPEMIVERLQNLFGEDPQFTIKIAKKMKEMMLEDLHANRKEEYMSAVGLAVLFDRSGGKMTEKMCDVIAKVERRTLTSISSVIPNVYISNLKQINFVILIFNVFENIDLAVFL